MLLCAICLVLAAHEPCPAEPGGVRSRNPFTVAYGPQLAKLDMLDEILVSGKRKGKQLTQRQMNKLKVAADKIRGEVDRARRAYDHQEDGTKDLELFFQNDAGHDLSRWYIDMEGKEHFQGVVGRGDRALIMSPAGHVTRLRSLVQHTFMHDFTMPDHPAAEPEFTLKPCGNESALPQWDPGREAEFQSLVDDQNGPCAPDNDSSSWSCLRILSQEHLDSRNPHLWGFHKGEQGQRKVGDTEDTWYEAGANTPNVTDVSPGRSAGYLKMRMTEKMREALLPWYEEMRPKAEEHGVIGGGYTNSHTVPMEVISLDVYGMRQLAIVREMRQILQWWTKMPLRHTSTFGVRIYKRGSMLINHRDIATTHIASAVLQIGQTVDKDGGWPLEVKTADGKTAEVYLQPGEMVLYEGARLKHGRPMRFRGEEFANVFTHFAPLHTWAPPPESPSGSQRAEL